MVAHRAIPMRREAIAEHDATLAQLARDGEPGHMRSAVSEIVLHLSNDDGGEPEPACSREDLRELRLRQGYDGLGVLDGTTTPVLSELLHRVRDLYSQPDPQDTPSNRRRTPAQRFHDALQDALTVAIDHHPGAAIGGVKTQIVLFCDLHTALGEDELARIAPRLGSTGRIDPDTARHLITTTNTTVRAVLGLGPWRPISVGRAMRNLPPWLRTAAQLAHVHCRGVGCDRPFAWTEADHNIEWTAGGETGLDNNAPLREGHHSLRHADGWTVTFDSDTGVVTWIPSDESRRIALLPPDP